MYLGWRPRPVHAPIHNRPWQDKHPWPWSPHLPKIPNYPHPAADSPVPRHPEWPQPAQVSWKEWNSGRDGECCCPSPNYTCWCWVRFLKFVTFFNCVCVWLKCPFPIFYTEYNIPRLIKILFKVPYYSITLYFAIWGTLLRS